MMYDDPIQVICSLRRQLSLLTARMQLINNISKQVIANLLKSSEVKLQHLFVGFEWIQIRVDIDEWIRVKRVKHVDHLIPDEFPFHSSKLLDVMCSKTNETNLNSGGKFIRRNNDIC